MSGFVNSCGKENGESGPQIGKEYSSFIIPWELKRITKEVDWHWIYLMVFKGFRNHIQDGLTLDIGYLRGWSSVNQLTSKVGLRLAARKSNTALFPVFGIYCCHRNLPGAKWKTTWKSLKNYRQMTKHGEIWPFRDLIIRISKGSDRYTFS